MNKLVVLSALVASVLMASGSSERILAGSYNSSGESVEKVRSNLAKQLSGYGKDVSVLSRKSGNYDVVVVEVSDKAKTSEVLSKVKQISEHKDAYVVRGDKVATQAKEPVVAAKAAKTNFEAPAAPKAPAVVETAPVFERGTKVEKKAPTGEIITLDSAVKTVLAENPKMKDRILQYQNVGKDLNIASNAYYPTLDLVGSYGYESSRINEKGTANSGIRKGDGEVGSAKLILTENIYNGGADENRIKQQNSRLNAAAFLVQESADRLTLQMTDAYLGLIREKELLDLAVEKVKSHEIIYNQIKERTSSGIARASEERQAGSRLTLAKSNLVAQQNNYQDAISSFVKLYGKSVPVENLVLPTPSFTLPESDSIVFNKATQCNPSILAQNANIMQAQYYKEMTKAAFRPKIDLEASTGYESTQALDRGDAQRETATHSVLLKMRYNLYNKGNDLLESEKSTIAIMEAEETLASLKRDLSESLGYSWQSYVLSQEKNVYLKDHIEYAKATLAAYEDEFKIGRRDLINLLDAETEYYNAMKEIILTQNKLLYAKYRLLDNMGLLTDSFEPGFAKKYIRLLA